MVRKRLLINHRPPDCTALKLTTNCLTGFLLVAYVSEVVA